MQRAMLRQILGLAALATLLALTGCGFKLRGQPPLPFSSVYIDAGRNSSVAPLLSQSLVQNGKKVLAKPGDAEVRVLLSDERYTKEILALTGGGKVAEYRLYYRLTLTALSHGGQQVLAPTQLQATRDYTFSDQELLAKQIEETQLRRDMEQEILRQVLRRLSFVNHS
jgi:LPS-assembly lipoprotein